MRSIGEAVEFLHGINIAHRDLKVSYFIAINLIFISALLLIYLFDVYFISVILKVIVITLKTKSSFPQKY